MKPTITAFANSPDRGRGLARDMQVRWALEEVGQAYQVRLVTFAQLKEPAHKARQPFGQIPTYEADGLVLFESGAIVLHIAETHGGLLPRDANARARAIAWMFDAHSTVEPVIVARESAILTEGDKPWHATRLPMLEDRIRVRLKDLAERLGDKEWLEGDFSAGDLLMIGVLRRLHSSGILKDYPSLAAYVARGEARPAFQRAFAAQLAVFQAAQKG
ncbi:MAG: glutathione S-transferase family protein [Alphaproteobacteria bacterium]